MTTWSYQRDFHKRYWGQISFYLKTHYSFAAGVPLIFIAKLPAPLVSTAALHLHLHLLLFGLSLSYVCTPLTLRGWWMEWERQRREREDSCCLIVRHWMDEIMNGWHQFKMNQQLQLNDSDVTLRIKGVLGDNRSALWHKSMYYMCFCLYVNRHYRIRVRVRVRLTLTLTERERVITCTETSWCCC